MLLIAPITIYVCLIVLQKNTKKLFLVTDRRLLYRPQNDGPFREQNLKHDFATVKNEHGKKKQNI